MVTVTHPTTLRINDLQHLDVVTQAGEPDRHAIIRRIYIGSIVFTWLSIHVLLLPVKPQSIQLAMVNKGDGI